MRRVQAKAWMLSAFLMAVMVWNSITPLQASGTADSGAKVSADFSQELSEDQREASVTINAFSELKNVKILGITLPNGEYVSGSSAVYEAVRNGIHEFVVDYEEVVGGQSQAEPGTPSILATPNDAEPGGGEIVEEAGTVTPAQ